MKKTFIVLLCIGLLGSLYAQKNDWSELEASVEKLLTKPKNDNISREVYLVSKITKIDILKGDSILKIESLPDFVQTQQMILLTLDQTKEFGAKRKFLLVWEGTIRCFLEIYETRMGSGSLQTCHRHLVLINPITYDNLESLSIEQMNKESCYATLPPNWREGANIIIDDFSQVKKDPCISSQYEATLSPTWEILRGDLLVENFHCTYFNYGAGEKQEAQFLLREVSLRNPETGEFSCLGVILEKFK